MTSLPKFAEWKLTCDDVHRAVKVLGKLRSLLIKPQPHDDHLKLQVVPQGVTTGLLLPSGCEFVLDFGEGVVDYYAVANTEIFKLPLKGLSPATLTVSLISQMKTVRFASMLVDLPSDQTPFALDLAQAGAYSRVLNLFSTTLTQFRRTLPGFSTPVRVTPVNFDLAFDWYGASDEAQSGEPYVRFGFMPQGHRFETPHLYAQIYAHSSVMLKSTSSAPIRHYTEEHFTGFVVHYDDLCSDGASEVTVEKTLNTIFQIIQSG